MTVTLQIKYYYIGAMMKSSNFKIQQNLDPHSNQANATRSRLQHRLYNHNQSHTDASANLSGSINNSSGISNTSTSLIESGNSNRSITFSAADQVYKIESGNQITEMQIIMQKLRQFNASLDGGCGEPTFSLFNHVNCHGRNGIFSSSSNMPLLSLKACNYNHSLVVTTMMLEILESIASMCDTAVNETSANLISHTEHDSGYAALMYALVASVVFGSFVFIANEAHTQYTQDKSDEKTADNSRSQKGYKMIRQ
jgi:hypothetical protein